MRNLSRAVQMEAPLQNFFRLARHEPKEILSRSGYRSARG